MKRVRPIDVKRAANACGLWGPQDGSLKGFVVRRIVRPGGRVWRVFFDGAQERWFPQEGQTLRDLFLAFRPWVEGRRSGADRSAVLALMAEVTT